MASKKRSSKTGAANQLTADENKMLDLYRKVQTKINTPPAPLVETVTQEEKDLLTAYRTGEYLPVHQHLYQYRRDVQEAYDLEHMRDFRPLGSYNDEAADLDETLPTAVEAVALHVGHELTRHGWVTRARLWGEGATYADLCREIAQSILEAFMDEYHDLKFTLEWCELVAHGKLIPASIPGGKGSTRPEVLAELSRLWEQADTDARAEVLESIIGENPERARLMMDFLTNAGAVEAPVTTE